MVKTFEQEQERISDSMHPEVRRVVAKLQEVLSCLSLILGRIMAEISYNLIDTNSFHTYWISRGRFLYPDCYLVRNLKGCLFDFSSWGLGRSGGALLFMEESIPFPP